MPKRRGSCWLVRLACSSSHRLVPRNPTPPVGVTDATHLVLHIRQHFRHNGWTPTKEVPRH